MGDKRPEILVNKGFGGGWCCLGPEGEGEKKESEEVGHGSPVGPEGFVGK